MNDYDFSTINDKEFEILCLDLLNTSLNLKLQGFKTGRDKGVDLRFSTPVNNNAIVVQAKHYVGSKYAQLKHAIKKVELDKIKKLKPDRYIVTTSLPLSASEKDELKDILNPFVQTSNDIFDKENLNDLLREYSEIEKKHFKLWFSSITVLESILNNAVEGRTRYHLDRVKEKIPYYVITEKLDEALNILSKEKLLLITGQPGIGKTTLADIILLEKAKNGLYIYKVENIREAEDVMSLEPEDKQLFYFDDFLGSNYVEIVNSKRSESQLTSFLERVRSTPNKYMVLTSRTVILNHAKEKYEKINRSSITNRQFELKLNDYSNYEKAKILYNHLYFNLVKEELYNIILVESFYRKIIQHRNYTPRIIEFITDKRRINSFSPEEYLQFILNNLNEPKEIWRLCFKNQIDYMDQCLLLTLFSFPGITTEQVLFNAFEGRLNYEKENHNQVIYANQSIQSIRILLDGFITSTIVQDQKESRTFAFINPSLTDFLLGYVSESFEVKKAIISSMRYVEQISKFDQITSESPLDKELQLILMNKISNDELKSIEQTNNIVFNNQRYISMLEILTKHCDEVNADMLLLDIFQKIDLSGGLWGIVHKLVHFLLSLENAPQTHDFIVSHFNTIIEALSHSIDGYSEAEKFPEIFRKYEQNYEEYCESDDGFENILTVIKSVLETNESEQILEKENGIMDRKGVEEIYEELHDCKRHLIKQLFPSFSFTYDFGIEADWTFWEDKIKENEIRAFKAEEDAELYRDEYREAELEGRFENDAIDDLFEKS